jgi:hypothetical protein
MEANGKNSFAVGGTLICFLGVSMGFVIAQQAPPVPRPGAVVANSPTARSGLNYFRQLLLASPAEREKLLLGKSPEHRQVLTNSLHSFDADTPEGREHRLRLLELRFDLAELMRLAPHQRASRLQFVRASERPLIEERLRIWDQCSPEDQKVLLEQERFVRVTSILVPMPGRGGTLSSAASNQLRQIEMSLDRFKSLPESRRTEIQVNFERIFGLPDPASARQQLDALPFSAAEREQMEKTLSQFRSLSKPQRDTCIRNFRKLSELTPEELRRFLRNVEEWQKLAPKDREEWRRIINTLPPFPPGMGLPPGPPMPSGASTKPLSTAVNRTNQ